MSDKPIMILCPKKCANKILSMFIPLCPHDEEFEDDLKEYGDTHCPHSGVTCIDHWKQFIHIETTDNDEEGDVDAD